MSEKEIRAKNPRYYEKSGKLYDAGVEISDPQAEGILRRNAARRIKNEKEAALAEKQDPMLGTMMRKMQAIANEGFDADEAELRPLLDKRKAKRP